MINQALEDIFTHDLENLTPRHVSLLTWCMVKLKYDHKPYRKALVRMVEKICRF